MGGTVAVTVRLENGTEYRMRRWTNALPWFYNNIKFFQKDPSHIQEYMKAWFEMKEDWEANHKIGNFQHNMTECYSPYPAPLAPYDYGIVVFDFQKNVIVNCQGYSSFEHPGAAHRSWDNERADAQVELYKAGRIKRAFTWTRSDGQVDIPIPKSVDEFNVEFLGDGDKLRPKHDWLHFEYDTSPFKVYEFLDHSDGWRQSKEVILDLGFKLSEEDEAAWKEHLDFYDNIGKENDE